MRKSVFGTLVLGFGLALWMGACGDGGGGTGSSGSASSSTSTSSSSSSSGTGGGGGMGAECTEVTVTAVSRTSYDPSGGTSIFRLTLGTMIGGAADDLGQIEFYDLGVSGTIDLATAPNDNYKSCTSCVRGFEDVDLGTGAVTKLYFQESGTLELGASAIPAITGSLKDVKLVEVTIDQMTYESTPVAGGTCLHITQADFKFDAAPDTYTCDPAGYGDHGACDCGDCGVMDPDCSNAMLPIKGCLMGQTCATGLKCEGVPSDWTCDPGKYNGGAGNGCDCGCGVPDPDCDLMGEMFVGCMMDEICPAGTCIPAGWTCDPTYYKDGSYCDCACGAYDPDCDDPMSTLFGCLDGQTCPTGLKCEGVPTGWTCDPAKYDGGAGNGCDCMCGAPDPDCKLMGEMTAGCMMGEKCGDGLCIPDAWTCKPSYFKDGECDCGCGFVDADCADATVGSCKWCNDEGSCNTAACPGTINPTNNAVCN